MASPETDSIQEGVPRTVARAMGGRSQHVSTQKSSLICPHITDSYPLSIAAQGALLFVINIDSNHLVLLDHRRLLQ